jgi:hypothetical protein
VPVAAKSSEPATNQPNAASRGASAYSNPPTPPSMIDNQIARPSPIAAVIRAAVVAAIRMPMFAITKINPTTPAE